MSWSRPIALRSAAALFVFLLTAGGGLALDQWSKVHAFSHLRGDWMDPYGPMASAPASYPLIHGLIDFQITRNWGAVFGLGQGKRTLFVIVSGAAILFIFYLFTVSGRQRFYQFILGLLLAGVLGNLYDRVTFGYVRDMIHALSRWPNLFPYIFNVADTMLCVGVGLMILHSFLHSAVKEKQGRGFAVNER